MPMYEFRCDDCGARFEDLVPVGTHVARCPECASERTVRVFSAPRAPLRLVKSRSAQRRQEVRNAQLNASAKARFKEARRKGREARGKGGSSGAT